MHQLSYKTILHSSLYFVTMKHQTCIICSIWYMHGKNMSVFDLLANRLNTKLQLKLSVHH